jgi:mannan endo-1,4-beta-mannosidase
VRAALGLLAVSLVGCGRQDLDLLVSVEGADPCRSFSTEAECHDNVGLGCSFQPNETGCLSTDPDCPPGQCRGGDPFVHPVGRSFFLNGKPFRFAGVSSWALLPATSCSTVSPEQREAWIQQAYDGLVPGRATVARFFAFQSGAGANGDDFSLLDASVRAARRAGIRLQLIVEHADGSCSQGEHRDDAWYTGGFRSPDRNYARSYLDYAEALARRYGNEPTVLGYTLLQGMGGADPQAMASFVTIMGQLLHGVARNQLVSLDLAWGNTGDDGSASYLALQQLPMVDLVDIDDYDFAEPPEPLSADLLATLAQIDKPAVVGEGAFRLDGDNATAFENRAAKARERMAEWKARGLSGALFWAYQPGWETVSEEFDARPTDPMLQPGGVLASAPW